MNRQQRRAAARGRSQPVAQQLETGPLQIQHGHTDAQVIIKFTRVTDHILLTPAQVDAFISAVQNSKKLLEAHQAGKKKPNG